MKLLNIKLFATVILFFLSTSTWGEYGNYNTFQPAPDRETMGESSGTSTAQSTSYRLDDDIDDSEDSDEDSKTALRNHDFIEIEYIDLISNELKKRQIDAVLLKKSKVFKKFLSNVHNSKQHSFNGDVIPLPYPNKIAPSTIDAILTFAKDKTFDLRSIHFLHDLVLWVHVFDLPGLGEKVVAEFNKLRPNEIDGRFSLEDIKATAFSLVQIDPNRGLRYGLKDLDKIEDRKELKETKAQRWSIDLQNKLLPYIDSLIKKFQNPNDQKHESTGRFSYDQKENEYEMRSLLPRSRISSRKFEEEMEGASQILWAEKQARLAKRFAYAEDHAGEKNMRDAFREIKENFEKGGIQNFQIRVRNQFRDDVLINANRIIEHFEEQESGNRMRYRKFVINHADRLDATQGRCDLPDNSRCPAQCVALSAPVVCTYFLPITFCHLAGSLNSPCLSCCCGSVAVGSLCDAAIAGGPGGERERCPLCPAIARSTYNCLTCDTSLIDISEERRENSSAF